jgi:hypothetical protein
MSSSLQKKAISRNSANRQHNVFRDEFYRDGKNSNSAKKSNARKSNNRSRGKKKMAGWVYVASSAILLCVIAVAGSSAVIWLRKLGALFGVNWTGD